MSFLQALMLDYRFIRLNSMDERDGERLSVHMLYVFISSGGIGTQLRSRMLMEMATELIARESLRTDYQKTFN